MQPRSRHVLLLLPPPPAFPLKVGSCLSLLPSLLSNSG